MLFLPFFLSSNAELFPLLEQWARCHHVWCCTTVLTVIVLHASCSNGCVENLICELVPARVSVFWIENVGSCVMSDLSWLCCEFRWLYCPFRSQLANSDCDFSVMLDCLLFTVYFLVFLIFVLMLSCYTGKANILYTVCTTSLLELFVWFTIWLLMQTDLP